MVGSGDRSRARPGQIRGVGENFQDHVGGIVQAVAVAVGGGIAEETIETVEGVEGGVGKFACEGAGGGEKAAVHTSSVVHQITYSNL